jgi:hypothetical protein
MPLFIDRLPMRQIFPGHPGMTTWLPLVPAILTDLDEETPSLVECRPWKVDTGNGLEAAAWRFHLERAGLSPEQHRDLQAQYGRSADGVVAALPVRRAGLWLVSNIPALRATPFPLSLGSGLPFYDAAHPAPESAIPLLGVRVLRRAGLKVLFDFAAATVSVSLPGSRLRGLARWLRRLPGRFATLSLDDLCPSAWA